MIHPSYGEPIVRKPKYSLRVDHYLRYFFKYFVRGSDFYLELPISYFFVLSDIFYRSLVLTDRGINLDQILITVINLCNKYFVPIDKDRPSMEIDLGIEREILLNLDGVFYNFRLYRSCRDWSSVIKVIREVILVDNSDKYLGYQIQDNNQHFGSDNYRLKDLVNIFETV